MKPRSCECAAEAGDDLVADLEGSLGLDVHDQVGVALTESGVDVGEPVPLVGQRADGLREKLDVLGLHRQLTLAGRHDRAVHADPVTEVEPFDGGERLVADHGFRHEELDLAGAVANRREDEFARVAQQHDAAGHGDALVGFDTRFQLAPRRTDLGHGVRAVEAVRIRRAACRSHLFELGEPPCLLGGEPTPGVQG